MPLLTDLARKTKQTAASLTQGLRQTPGNYRATKDALDKVAGDSKVSLKDMVPSRWQVESAARTAVSRAKGLWQGRYKK